MIYNTDITGIILAGGKSSRMGSNKALLTFKGKSIIEHTIDLLKPYCSKIIISANGNDYNSLGYEIVPDNFLNIGPIAGLEACLRHSNTEANIIVPCDTPFLDKEFIETLLSDTEDFDAVVPRASKEKIEPLTAFYTKNVLPILVQQIEKGDFKVQNLLSLLRTKYVRLSSNKQFENINTPADYNILGKIEN